MKHRSVGNTSWPVVPRILAKRPLLVLLDSFTTSPSVLPRFRTALKATSR
jgi:hypothetical protein